MTCATRRSPSVASAWAASSPIRPRASIAPAIQVARRTSPSVKLDRIRALGAVSVRKMDGIEETIKFPLPKGLKLDDMAAPGHIS